MLVNVELGADFSRMCALPVIAHTFLVTRPRLAIRELTRANGQLCKSERGRSRPPAPFARSGISRYAITSSMSWS